MLNDGENPWFMFGLWQLSWTNGQNENGLVDISGSFKESPWQKWSWPFLAYAPKEFPRPLVVLSSDK